ncbi:MAG TPA: tetratricopeptide repeat protein [Myxococcota bacterium]|nr:tetratricopeptide repeat protein [Myxococcota bacterium]
MAADKRKILENARKYAQKGAKDKALKEYQKLVKLDPKDSKLRLEIGDAYRRWGQVDEAIDTYQKVADQYMREGFDARAVAVFKQLLSLDPNRYSAYEPLADLYERMGLTSEAINALQTAADGYHKAGKKREALELLRKMATIDPSNTTSRIKVAELLRQENLNDEAATEYEHVATELERQSDYDAASNVYRRLLELDPKRETALAAFARNLLRQNKAPEAESVAKRAIAVNGEEPAHYELLADAYRAQKREDMLPQAYQPLVELYQKRGDGERARELMQRFMPVKEFTAEMAQGDLDRPFDDDSVHPENARGLEASDDSPFSNDGFESEDDLEADIELDESLALSGPEIELTHVADTDSDQDSEPVIEQPEGDPDQLLAEASVYLRYGKSDKAIAHLQAILAAHPTHRGALEKLGEAFVERSEPERAVELWVRAARAAKAEGATEVASLLRDRIAALDPKAAAALGPAPAPKPAPKPVEAKPTKVEVRPVRAEPKAAPKVEVKPAPAPPRRAAAPEPEPEEFEVDLGDEELDLDVDLSEVESDEPQQEAPAASAQADEAPADEESVDVRSAADTGIEGQSLSTATTQQILEDLEEADFYMEQGLLDEAEKLFQGVLAIAPNHPRALVRLGELAASRGGDPSAPTAKAEKPAPAPKAAPAKPAAKPAPARPAPKEIEIEEPAAVADLSLDEDLAPAPAAAADVPDDEIAAAFSLDTTENLPPTAHDPSGDTPIAPAPPLRAETKPAPAPPPPAPKPVAPPLAAAPEESGDFDLAAELSDAFDDPAEKSASEDVDFATVFAAFKRGVSETLDEGDYEAHYDLGIAYKEMGLWDDAIAEFHIAMGNAARETECVHLIGLCGIDSGRPEMAVDQLERLLKKPGLVKDQALVVRFDLGRAQAALGKVDAARACFQAVMAQDPKFQDVAKHLAALDAPAKGGAKAAAGDAAGFESFDDMLSEMSDDDETDEEKPDPAGESFEDVSADADDEAEPEPAAAAVEEEPEPEPEPAPPPKPAAKPAPAARSESPRAPAAPAASKKKKKISFL